ncbi:MAG: class I SAM-dependent methyltransferase [Alphaproteobacteria bacterium]|nr:MAG: class I SAM-dependent methyltransferase [Alphaproteobacteria bacterium]
MERCSEEDFELKSYWLEHAHRYSFAARLASGDVADCACGIGYGSVFFKENTEVTSYIGFDPSEDAIKVAHSKYSQNASGGFNLSTLENIPLRNASVDTFVSLETLEHLVTPVEGLGNIRRVLKDDGIFIGSVPTQQLEELATLIYGPNEYHLHKFDRDKIITLLGGFFECVELFNVSLVLGTYAKALDEDTKLSNTLVVDRVNELTGLGSYFFICGKKSSVDLALKRIGNASALYFPGVEKIIV